MINCRVLVDRVIYFCIVSIEHCIVQVVPSDLFEQIHYKLRRRNTHSRGTLT